MSTTYFYSDLNNDYSEYKNKVEKYAKEKEQNIYMIKMPKNYTNDFSSYGKCFVLLSPGFKLSLVNVDCESDDFENYCFDIEDAVSYLFINYEYNKELGRFRPIYSKLKYIANDINELNDLENFFSKIKLEGPEEKKLSAIFVALCIGSVNDISRVKKEVPQTLLQKVKQKIQLFDADQTRFIYQHLDQKRIKIQGLSGTGKTELLLHKLKELYTKDDNLRIFVTCHNKILADALRTKIPKFFNFLKVSRQIEWDERLWCANAWGKFNDENSGLYRYLCSFYNIPYSRYSRYSTFGQVCKRAIEEIKKLKEIDRDHFKYAFNYILIDECQDFPDSFFDLCELVTKDQIYMAGDIFQSIFEEHKLSDYDADYYLTKCYRTDPKTLMFAHGLGLGLFESKKLRWLRKEDWEACGYTYKETGNMICLSREPVVRFLDVDPRYKSVEIRCFPIDEVVKSVYQTIIEIKNDNKDLTVNDMCIILLDDQDYIYTWANQIENMVSIKFNWAVNKAYETKHTIKDTLLISNRNNVKGLEYPFVICVTKGLVASEAYRNSIYTMLTRSFLKSYLLISSKQEGNSKVLERVYENINQRLELDLKKPSEKELKTIETSFKRLTNRKPLAEEIRERLIERGIPKGNIEKLVASALNLGWQDLSYEELQKKVDQLIAISDL